MIVAPFQTPLGWMALLADSQGLVSLSLPQRDRHSAIRDLCTRFGIPPYLGENPLTDCTRDRVQSYLLGNRVRFDDLPLSLGQATQLQKKVWKLTSAIPYGETRTYGELARVAGLPRGARAIGQCMSRNPLPIIIPCHRVVSSNGALRGYAGGIPLKQKLLAMEGAT